MFTNVYKSARDDEILFADAERFLDQNISYSKLKVFGNTVHMVSWEIWNMVKPLILSFLKDLD